MIFGIIRLIGIAITGTLIIWALYLFIKSFIGGKENEIQK